MAYIPTTAAGILWSLIRIPKPELLDKTLSNLSKLATPLGLMAMGASFQFKQAKDQMRPAIISSIFKLVVFCVMFLPVASWFGFRDDKLVAILIMLGSATTVSSFVMAKNMGHEGTLTAADEKGLAVRNCLNIHAVSHGRAFFIHVIFPSVKRSKMFRSPPDRLL